MYNIFLSFSFNHLSNTCKKKYNTHTHTLISFIEFTHTPYSHTFTQLSQFNYNHNTLKINKKKNLKWTFKNIGNILEVLKSNKKTIGIDIEVWEKWWRVSAMHHHHYWCVCSCVAATKWVLPCGSESLLSARHFNTNSEITNNLKHKIQQKNLLSFLFLSLPWLFFSSYCLSIVMAIGKRLVIGD